MQSDNEKMLQEIVQNTEMGKNTLDELMSLTHDQKLRDEMLRQKREYRRINQAAHTALDAIGAEAHGQSAAARMSVSMGFFCNSFPLQFFKCFCKICCNFLVRSFFKSHSKF